MPRPTPDHIRAREAFLKDAVRAGKVVQGSKLYTNLSATFDIRPQAAEQIIAQLTANPLPAGHVAAAVPQSDEYPQNWLTGGEQRDIANARAGIASPSHFVD